ncbi:PQQ-binding-like beta-propeller repeat protein [Actinomadura sp. 7K507]|uniref:outer membrane protein assembly factor BamB family protein n=1 Tax=Actinomadura sp. 7K507 TaxID=2530365 RepID=UPI0010512384|nr:PQQ-binding-like beta-propeller repeat protein [Actinomadura sp. 7K507]TDC88270.1 hypothetical protein E1285_18640 [Actinomadura sp. 7K507]
MLPKSNRSRALAAGAVLVAVVTVFTLVRACGSGGSDIDPLPDGEERPALVSFSDKPMWDERKLGMVSVAGVELRGDVAIVAGDAADGARLAVVDVRTGRARWVADVGFALRNGGGAQPHDVFGLQGAQMTGVTGKPVVYGDGDDWTVLVQYSEGPQRGETEIGVAALSGKDGAVRWKHALIRPRPGGKGDDDREQKVRLLAADTRAVLTSLEGERGSDPKTIALDPATGGKLWENTDGWAYRFSGGLLLGETSGEQAPSWPRGREREGAHVFALDVKTGKKRWDLSGAFESSHLDAVAGGTAVVQVVEREPDEMLGDRRTVLLDAATGRETGSGGAARDDEFRGCGDDGRTLIACEGPDGRLMTIRPGTGQEPFITRKPPFDGESRIHVHLVRQDRIFVRTSPAAGRPVRHAVVDRAANRAGPAPHGAAGAASETAIAFRVDRKGSSPAPEGLVVHAAAVGAQSPEPGGPGKPALAPPRIDAAPLWTAAAGETPAPPQARDTGLRAIRGIDLVGDAIVYTGRGRDDQDPGKLVVADAMTGAERWSVREDASLGGGAEAAFVTDFHTVHAGGEPLLLIRYTGPGGEQGFAALSLRDGAVRWKKRVPAGDGTVLLEAADAEVIVVEVTKSDDLKDVRDETIVYAAGSRRELWRERGVEPVGAGGGVVLVSRHGPGEPGDRRLLDLIAYGAADGKRRWRLGDRYREPELLPQDAGGGTIVVGTADGAVVLDRDTGRELAKIHTPLDRCDGDGDALIVCETGPDAAGRDRGGRAMTIQTRDGVTKIHDLLETGTLTRYTATGNWFIAVRPATRSGARETPERFLLFDGEGRRISGDLPGVPTEIGGGLAILTPSRVHHGISGDEVSNFAVHRVRS